MAKRRLDDDGFANVLRQKPKEDPRMKQAIAQNTFAMLMRNAQRPAANTEPAPAYLYVKDNDMNDVTVPCHKCPTGISTHRCTFCEHYLCQNCVQQCNSCQLLFCTTCSVIDYSQYADQIFCLSCKQG